MTGTDQARGKTVRPWLAGGLMVLLACSASLAAQAGRARPTGRRSAISSDAKFTELVGRANQAREAGRLQDAIGLYRQALTVRPTWVEGWWHLGTVLYDLDSYREGAEAFGRVVALKSGDEKNGPAWALLGLCQFQTGDYPAALESLERAQGLGVGDKKELRRVMNYHAGLLMNRFERFEHSFLILSALATEHFESVKIVEALGINVLRLAVLPGELVLDNRALVAQAGRAAAFAAARQMAEAEREYEKLVREYSTMPSVHYARGVFLLNRDPDTALRELERELEISPADVQARLYIAFEYIKRTDYAAGLPYAERAVSLDPQSFAARNALGRILLELGQVERAITELEEGVRLAPDSPETRFALARAYARAGRKADADRERAEFVRLNKILRTVREGPEAVKAAPPPEC
ncbi:MAG: tetratricopeptide repeat protein [Acidobacteriota bacterium]